ncbi:uncharacterized protein K444DRAFT_150117 [Hyaloscypha bicolor E]|uniref:Secreted protein n=1 Tax=Hyaloscypha bicolor E TaxID=1095630 RepID=A0A2J6SS49_9HELO|nr:uncharacterized protein K444DRAFT_150117 [Hyaloscypha bicolor E]PMD53570.1 hypothetical protein K444DRAFT_150117 [Hyaloscypha bicolor E]
MGIDSFGSLLLLLIHLETTLSLVTLAPAPTRSTNRHHGLKINRLPEEWFPCILFRSTVFGHLFLILDFVA